MNETNKVYITKCSKYDEGNIYKLLPDKIFEIINPGAKVVLKPNWVMESNKFRKNEWEQVITHPAVIEAVIKKVLGRLLGKGRIAILDGPMTEANFEKLSLRYPFRKWKYYVESQGVAFEVIDLRDHEWKMNMDVVVERKKLSGDPRGKIFVNLKSEDSEFFGHTKSVHGYYGADYDSDETNTAHDGLNNIYSVSKTVIDSDVFINIPKLKTHRTAGITCCLKNLVGINTYKNFLPHYSLGGPSSGGDQFPYDSLNLGLEKRIVYFIKKNIFGNENLARIFYFLNPIGKKVFGDSKVKVRNGSWYGNDTLWRMVLDLNKILFFANTDGSMKSTSCSPKKYIGVVDAIVSGEGEGPLSPDSVFSGFLISGYCPASIDACCATLMGFDPGKIPIILNAFCVRRYKWSNSLLSEIYVDVDGIVFALRDIASKFRIHFKPQHGWKGNIESSF